MKYQFSTNILGTYTYLFQEITYYRDENWKFYILASEVAAKLMLDVS